MKTKGTSELFVERQVTTYTVYPFDISETYYLRKTNSKVQVLKVNALANWYYECVYEMITYWKKNDVTVDIKNQKM